MKDTVITLTNSNRSTFFKDPKNLKSSPELKSELIGIVNIQVDDNTQAVTIDDLCNNVPMSADNTSNALIRSQKEIG